VTVQDGFDDLKAAAGAHCFISTHRAELAQHLACQTRRLASRAAAVKTAAHHTEAVWRAHRRRSMEAVFYVGRGVSRTASVTAVAVVGSCVSAMAIGG